MQMQLEEKILEAQAELAEVYTMLDRTGVPRTHKLGAPTGYPSHPHYRPARYLPCVHPHNPHNLQGPQGPSRGKGPVQGPKRSCVPGAYPSPTLHPYPTNIGYLS